MEERQKERTPQKNGTRNDRKQDPHPPREWEDVSTIVKERK